MKSRLLTVLLVGVLVVLSIHLVQQWLGGLRADLTERDLYSLSPGSEAILERMREEGVQPVEITLFFSEQAGKTLPRFVKDFIAYERYLRSLLREYEQEARGKIRVRYLDPVTDSDEAQLAADHGLDGKLINEEGDLFYFGLAFETQTGSREAIEFLWPQEQESIEYEITKTLHRLLWPDRQRVAVLSSLEVFGSAQDPFLAQMMAVQGRQPTEKWLSIQLLEELYEVEQLATDVETISPDEVDLVVVIHPKDLPRKAIAALDEWIVRGGNTLVLVDPYSIADQPPQNPQQPWAALQYEPSSNLDDLFAAWGIERAEDTFAADLSLAVRRPVSQRGPAESVVVDLVIDENSAADTLDESQPPLRGLSNLRFLLAGVLEQKGAAAEAGAAASSATDGEEDAAGEGAAGVANEPSPASESGSGLELVPLVTTTGSGGRLVVQPGFAGEGLVYTDFNDPAKLRDNLELAEAPLVLAYLLRGRFPSAFADGYSYPSREAETPPGLPPGIELPPPEDAETVTRPAVPDAERAEASVIVFADVDFVSDVLAFSRPFPGITQAANDNPRLFLNAVDFLLGSQELMQIRTTKRLHRPFELFDEIENAAERETLDRERQIRDEIEQFEEELRAKQSEMTSRGASLFQKRLQDEVDELNSRIQEANRELTDIRRGRREALEREESRVRFAVMGWMPVVVLVAGVALAYRRVKQG
jgi:ABC-type uncharacterized transport system involved in gliding motility auxiliary subunit